MKVNKVVGWLTGQAGTGNIFELEQDGKLTLAMIWQDGKFHGISVKDVQEHISAGKAALKEPGSKYQNLITEGAISVENPAGWQRLYIAPGTEQPAPEPDEEEQVTEDQIVFPFSLSFSGEVKVKLGGISKLFKLIE